MIDAEPWKNSMRPACKAAFARVILDDHVRLPWRFFGQLTAAQAYLTGR